MKKIRVVLALGGNAIQNKGEKGTFEEQLHNVSETMKSVAELIANKQYQVVITHGNGPQVGNIMIQQDAAKNLQPVMPMHMCGAMSQGQIGYLIQQSLSYIFHKKHINKNVTTLVTQTVVDKKSSGFVKPSKPVGPYYTKAEAEELAKKTGFVFREDAGRGYRRVVASPQPLRLVEMETIKILVEKGEVVVASGGGGIPVVIEKGGYRGVDAVIDKDRAAALLATELKADLLVILTAVDKVCLNYGKINEKKLDSLSRKEALRYMEEGHFAAGSMGPKIEAAIAFLEQNKKGKVIITHAHSLKNALKGKNGTVLVN